MATEDDPDINGLQSEIIYYKLNKASDDYTQDSKNFWNTVIAYHPMNKLGIFPSLAKGFYYVSKMNELDTYYDERWNFLYFWAGIKMLENLGSSDSSQGFSFTDLMDLLKMVRSINDNGSSYMDDMLKMNKDNFKDLKDVYDYLENYKSIDLKIDSSGNSPCTARYKEYVTKAHELYKREKEKCQRNNKDEYCRILNSFLLKHEKTFITQPKCTGTKPVNPHSEEENPKHTMDSEGSGVHHKVHGQGAQTLFSPLGDSGQTRGIPLPGGDVPPSSRSTNAISTVFPLLGTASLAFFFLKFTPLGSSLYNRIFSKQIIRTNVEESQELLENSYEFPNTNIEENSHHIGYHNM
ncbi:PIR protein [Plasmodium ovale]|uniref:PIR Superfamily Protein n=2 Tax=Plasmodium ovale TaxID=36330 RepID=A0A1A8WEM7_PLAOA|nr:PIR Superfamily Protein [Plasmodium ovale curtisi]SBT83639.1 PIR protein [Plasmodium ovale]